MPHQALLLMSMLQDFAKSKFFPGSCHARNVTKSWAFICVDVHAVPNTINTKPAKSKYKSSRCLHVDEIEIEVEGVWGVTEAGVGLGRHRAWKLVALVWIIVIPLFKPPWDTEHVTFLRALYHILNQGGGEMFTTPLSGFGGAYFHSKTENIVILFSYPFSKQSSPLNRWIIFISIEWDLW